MGRPSKCGHCRCTDCDTRLYPISEGGDQDERDFYEGLNVVDSDSYATRLLIFPPLESGQFKLPNFGIAEFITYLKRGGHIIVYGNKTGSNNSASNSLLSSLGSPFSFIDNDLFPNSCTEYEVSSFHILGTGVESLSLYGSSTVVGGAGSDVVITSFVSAKQRYLGWLVAISDWDMHDGCSFLGDLNVLYNNICGSRLYGNCFLCSAAPKIGSAFLNIGDVTWDVPEEVICDTEEGLLPLKMTIFGNRPFYSPAVPACDSIFCYRASQTVTHRFRSIPVDFLSGDISLENGHGHDDPPWEILPDTTPEHIGDVCHWRKIKAKGLHILHHNSNYTTIEVPCWTHPNGVVIRKNLLSQVWEAEYEDYLYDYIGDSQWELEREPQPTSFAEREYRPFGLTVPSGGYGPDYYWYPAHDILSTSLNLYIEPKDPRYEYSSTNPFYWRLVLISTFSDQTTLKGWSNPNCPPQDPNSPPWFLACRDTNSYPVSSPEGWSINSVTFAPQRSCYRIIPSTGLGPGVGYYMLERYIDNEFTDTSDGPTACPPYRVSDNLSDDTTLSVYHRFITDKFTIQCTGGVQHTTYVPQLTGRNYLLVWEKEVDCKDLENGEFTLQLVYDNAAEFFGLTGYRDSVDIRLELL